MNYIQYTMKIDKRIIILIAIIVILSIGVAWGLYTQHTSNNDNRTLVDNSTVKNATMNESSTTGSSSESGEYGYCAICGKALTYAEANDDYTQGKICHSCAANPYYETGEGADYANKKLSEAYPEEYSWMNEDTSSYEDYEDTDDYPNDEYYEY